MAKGPRSTEAKIELLESRVNNPLENATAVLGKALTDKNSFVVAHAAHLAQSKLLYDLIPDLVQAYRRLLVDAVKSDKTCAGKRHIMRCLYELDYEETEFFMDGIKYVQQEPVWGGYVDTAVEIRCHAAMALAAGSDPDAVYSLIPLLYDREPAARCGAVKAVALLPEREALIILRQKILQNDEDEADIIADCLNAVMKINADHSLDFVVSLCRHHRLDFQEAAYLALGESRHPKAWEYLQANVSHSGTRDPLYRVMLRAMALMRSEQAFDYLTSLVRDENAIEAVTVLEILSVYDYHDKLRAALRQAAGNCRDERIQRAYHRYWNSQGDEHGP